MLLLTALSLLNISMRGSCEEYSKVKCDEEKKRDMHTNFVKCTTSYKEEYSRNIEHLEAIEEVTCWLVENIVETCGDLWSHCHLQEEVRRMKDLHVESLLIKNKGASVDIEKCMTVKEFRLNHVLVLLPSSSNFIS